MIDSHDREWKRWFSGSK